MSIYRAYDIRGIYGKDLTDEVAVDIGKAFGSSVEGSVAVGRDVRLSSPALSEALIKGLQSTGLHVIDVGVVPTPLLYFTIHHLSLDGGIMVTGSHNPPEYNGFKLCRGGTMTLYGPEIKALGDAVEERNFRTGEGTHEKIDVIPVYLDFVKERVNVGRKLKLVLDCANGTAGAVAPKLFEQLGCEVTTLYEDPDGSFPNHPADPTVDDNLKELIDRVRSEGADIGLSYDGDSDRAGFVTEEGGIVRGDMALALFSRGILEKNPGASIIFEVKCSQALFEDIEAHGGKPIMYRTGHSFIKKKIKEENALIAGEMSGHFFFADNYPGYDDGIYASARMVELLSDSGMKLSELVDTIPKYHSTPEIRVDAPEEVKFKLVEEVKKEFMSREGLDVITVDGVRVQTPDGWGLMRASNTGPKIIIRFEGKTPEKLDEMKAMFQEVFDKYPVLKGKI
ncbi:MAG: phosphomannomutase [Candidatus Altiarchaeales archaeon]|nr:phosphomannomutase [Candidatus Altiarchaeales archaeon]MBD3416612.1 phosphomannomutase [Candidatus Altiarchaeales archaeon]